jgi:hypothetical protein
MQVPVVLLGPQRLAPTVGEEAAAMGLIGPVGVITAGWQEREEEDEELREALGLPAMNLRLYSRWEDVQARDPEFHELHRARQDRLRRIQEFYRSRLEHLMASALDLFAARGPEDLVEEARTDAVEALRQLDAAHVERVHREHVESERTIEPGRRPVIAGHRREVARLLAECEGVAVAGGHVAILLNRLRLFGLDVLLRGKPVLAWSAGAMTLTERVVLFHDHTPQGDGHPDVLDVGLGIVPGAVVLPHARHRLALDRKHQVAIMARRFAPARCLPMNERHRAFWDGQTLHLGTGLAALQASGETGADYVAQPQRDGAEPLSTSDVAAPSWAG